MRQGRSLALVRMRARNVLLSLVVILATLVWPPPALTAPAARPQAPVVSGPRQATAGLHLPGPSPRPVDAAALAVQPEIQALAAGLDNDPLLIYDYVLNNYDTVPVYGQLKNPRDTVLSRRGNPFDQAALLSDLLRAAGYETEYVLGIIQLPVAQAMNWVGADTPAVLAGVLDAGGIYREVVGDVLRLKHVWLRAKVAGTWYSLDPSMKPYTYTQGMDLGAILGYNRATYMAAALSGATVTADYAENLNTANIEAQLAQYATNLAQYLRNNAPFASLADAVGGRRIVPQTVAALPTQLPYTVQQVLGTFTDLPADLQYALHVELPGLNYQTTIPAIAGDRVTITYVGATEADQSAIAAAGGIDHVYPAYTVNMVPELRVGGVLVATGSPAPLGSTQTVSTTVATPYFIGDTRVVWPTRSNRLTVGAFYAFPMSVEGISEEALRRHHGLLETYSAAGLAEESEPVRGESLYLIGTSYFNQIEACARLDAGLARVVFFRQMLSAFTSQNLVVTEWTSVGGTPQPARVAWGSYGINVVPGNRTLRSASGDGQAARAFETQMEQRASAAEHAILERLQGNPAISTVRALALTNAAHTPIYRLDSSNIEALLPGLDCSPVLRDLMRQYVAQGRVVIVPQLRLLYNQWQGTGFWVFDPPSGQLDGLISGELVSGSGQSLEGPPTMGGDGTLILSVDMNMLLLLLGLGQQVGTGCNEGCNKADPNAPNNAGKDPVDTTTGAFVHHTADLAFGALGIPIEFVRTYNSASRNAQGPLGYGWTHSYALRLATSSDWARGLGFRTAMDAVAAIAEAYVGLDLASAPVGGLSLERLLVGTLGAHWSTAQVIDNVITVTGAEGEHHQYLRLPDGGYQPGHGDYTMLVANGDGTHTVWDKAGGRTEFDAQGRGTALVDANGNRTSLTYDGQGQLAGVTDAAGQAIDLTYTDGLLTQIVDPAGRTFRYGYDTSGDLITCTDPLGSVTRYAYDAQRQLMTLTDPEGVTFTTNGYDPWHRVMRQVDGRGGIMTISYGDVRSVITDPLGNRTIYFYDRNQRLVGMADHYGNRTYVVYDANDNTLRTTDRAGHTMSYAYDAHGNMTRITDGLGYVTAFAYDAQDNLIALTDRLGATTRYEYDGRRNLVRVTDPLGHATAHTYDGRGQRTSTTDANGHQVTTSYDTQGNLASIVDGLGHATTMTYDNLGRLLTIADASGHTARYAYDDAGRLLRVTDPLGGVSAFTYDRNTLRTSTTDALGRITRYGYDAQFNLTVVTDTLGSFTRYAYDLNGRLTEMTDANGHTTRYTRDALGRLVQTTDPLSRVVTVAYDANDQQVALTRADGRTIRYEYDAAGHLTRTAYPDGSTATHVYDAGGRLTRSSYGTWQAQYTYDAAGQLTRTDLPGEGLSVACRYDPGGNRLAIEVRRSSELLYDARYAYDAANRLASATDALTGYAVNYSYNDDDTLSAVHHSSGARASYTYDAGHRITRLDQLDAAARSLSSSAYTYDAVGNLLRAVQTTPGGALTTDYAYDALDRLLREQHARYALEYAYDAVGNRTRETGPLGAVAYTYDAADQLLSAGPVTFAYDVNGNQVRRTDAHGTYTFAYDDGNHLAQITAPGDVRTAFRYDAAGRRVGVQGPAGTVQTVYDGDQALLEGVAGFAQGQVYLWGADSVAAGRPLGDDGAPLAAGYLGDRLGNMTGLTDAGGTLRGSYTYEGFGRLQTATRGAPGALRFQGLRGVRAETAPSTLYWMGYRYYDASTGRFLTTDPLPGQLAQPAGLNRYAYALNNPLRYIDPLGLRPWEQLSEKETWERLGQEWEKLKNIDTSKWTHESFPEFTILRGIGSESVAGNIKLPPLQDMLHDLLTELQVKGFDVTPSAGGENQPSMDVNIQPQQTQQFIDTLIDVLHQHS